MNVLVDTSVWSLSLRRLEDGLNSSQMQIVAELRELISEGRAQLLGIIRQEILSGIRSQPQFEKIRTVLQSFRDASLEESDYEAAAHSSNLCRSKGIAVSVVDALISSTAVVRGWSVFTTDRDFHAVARVIPIKLHFPRK